MSLGFGMRLLLPSSSPPFFFSFCRQSSFFYIFTMASRHIGNTWRHVFFYQKGHGAQKKGHGVMKKGHGAMPFYFSLDKTL
jgi:hypothetical protein